MPISMNEDTKTTRFAEEGFRDEAELQACLERSPWLLVFDKDPPVAAVQREVALPSAGVLDLLIVDQEGLPVAVEVKLARNTQSRRAVVAQAFDYISDLSGMTFEELDDRVEGALDGALSDLAVAGRDVALRKQCATNLRAGRIRLVIAVDSPTDDLIRIVRYIADHSDIDVRLVAVSKYAGGRIIVPRILVARPSDAPTFGRREPAARSADSAFEAAIDAYDSTAPEEWRTRGHAGRYRQIRADEWPGALHYEFQNYADEIGVELHLESDDVKGLSGDLGPLAGRELEADVRTEWDGRWYRNRGRLLAKIGKGDPEAVARLMRSLISLTRPVIEKQLRGSR